MAFSYSRRDIVVAAFSVGLVVLAQPGIAAPMSFKVDLHGAQQCRRCKPAPPARLI